MKQSTIDVQGAFASLPAAAGLDLSTEIIVCTLDSFIAEYRGTRAALETEGVIPAGTKWPDGFDDLRWNDDKFSYRLRRMRPDGVKGPRKQFLDVNWWMFRCNPIETKSWDTLAIERKANALKEEIYRHSTKGKAEQNERWNRYWEAKNDERFQAFKSLIPGINRPARGCRPKNAEQSKGASA